MKIYFIRHGQSEQNALAEQKGVEEWQGSDGKLTEKGRNQAKAAGEQIKDKAIDIVIASTHERALETGSLIAQKLGVSIETSPLLVERRNPKEIWYAYDNNPGIHEIVAQLYEHFHDDTWRYADEENASDLQSRAQKALDYLAALPYSSIAVVSHGCFLRHVFSRILPPEYIHWNGFSPLTCFTLNNGAIVEATYENGLWKLPKAPAL